MKPVAHAADLTVPVAHGSRLADFVMLTKPRLNLLVMVTAIGGLYLAAPEGVPVSILVHTVIGTALVAGGAAAFNQVWERETDARMKRTQSRPVPAGRLNPGESLVFALVLSLTGLAELVLAVNLLCAAVAALTLISYVAVYTPLKRRTSLATLVGAVPGALPPVIGWTAATESLSLAPLVLFGIVFLWQMPHFLAIAWMFRDEYAAAGIPLLPVLEPEGHRTGRQALFYAAALWPVSLMPTLLGLTGGIYLAMAALLGGGLILAAVKFASERSLPSARRLFLYSIVYLPLLWAALVADRLWI